MSNATDLHTVPVEGHDDHPNFYDTQQLRALSESEQQAELLILSQDTGFIDVVKGAAPRIVGVVTAADLDSVAKTLPNVRPGVLVVDMSIGADLSAMLPKLEQRFPEVVIVVAGKREDVAGLMRLTAAGHIFRYLLFPVSHGQARLALGAAIAQHLGKKAAGQRTADTPVAAPSRTPMLYGAIGAGMLVVIGGIWLTLRGASDQPATPSAAAVQPPPARASTGRAEQVQAMLAAASQAFVAGNYVEPRGSSAIDLYRKALELDPASESARSGIASVADKLLDRAQQSLTTERVDEAVQDIQGAREINPQHPRLEFLEVQVRRERERQTLSEARDRANRVRKLVAQATADTQAQRLISPPGSNARDALMQAQRLDAADPAVAMGISDLIAALTEAARKAVAAGNTTQAREFADAARKLGGSDAALAAIESSLASPGRSGAPSAAGQPAQSAAVARERAAADASRREVAPAVSTSRNDSGSNVPPAENQPADSVAAVAAPNATTAPAGSAVEPAADEVLQAATLPRTREVEPDYPTQAALDGIEGWVDIDFTISPEGVPEDLKVRDASPRRLFDRAAMSSLREWRFEPIIVNGTPVARRATLRVRFQPR